MIRRLPLLWVLCLPLAACASQPTRPTLSPAPPPPDTGQAQRKEVFEQASDAARRLEAEGRLGEALWQWRVAEAVAPSASAAQRPIAALTARIEAEAAQAVREGDRLSARRADRAAARASYEAALRLDPSNTAARRALRRMDREAMLPLVERSPGGPTAPAVDRRR